MQAEPELAATPLASSDGFSVYIFPCLTPLIRRPSFMSAPAFVPHRIELVREKDGVRYYNSSIDSSPNRTINTLKVFPEKVIMICGGKDKGIPYDDIGEPIADNVKTLILIGATSGKIKEALINTGRADEVKIIEVSAYSEAVSVAHSEAKEGDVVLLSPASTSFDMFRNFEERGNLFKKLVMEL